MARDRVYTSSQYRVVVDDMKEKDVLGLGLVEGKDTLMLAVALGLANPTQLPNRVGLFLNTALKTTDKALMSSVLLGTVTEDDEIDAFADLDKCLDLCEQCAEAGYQNLLKKYNDAGCDNEVFERMLLKELDFMYSKNVDGDLK